MNQNSMAIILLCSHLCTEENVNPFEPAEWAKLSDRFSDADLCPKDIMRFTDDDFKAKLNFGADEIQRINRLLSRTKNILHEIRRYSDMGINIMTKEDEYYPKVLENKLGKSCPPIFYYAGNPEISDKKCVGFVGSRNINANDEAFTVKTVAKINANGYAVVSGGARGIDSVSSAASINNGNFCIEYISDSLINKIKSKNISDAVINKRLLILSVAKPDAGFTTGIAMMRNNFIYAHSDGTVVVRADYNKGGTWNGAVTNLKKQRCIIFCWDNAAYEGNAGLINRGAVPIDESWDGDVSEYKAKMQEKENTQYKQLSLFDL